MSDEKKFTGQVPQGKFDDEEDFDDEPYEDYAIEEHETKSPQHSKNFDIDEVKKQYVAVWHAIEQQIDNIRELIHENKLGNTHPIISCLNDLSTANSEFKRLAIDKKDFKIEHIENLKRACHNALSAPELIKALKPTKMQVICHAFYTLACYLALPFQKLNQLRVSSGHDSTVYKAGLPRFHTKTKNQETIDDAIKKTDALSITTENPTQFK